MIYVLNIYREKLEFPSLIRKIVQMHNLIKDKYKHSVKVLVEDKASGTQIIQSLRKDHNIHPIAIKPEHDKKARLMGISHFIENGVCLFPGHNPHWWSDFENELLKFPQGKYDDQCDAFSQGLNYPDKATAFDTV